MGTWTQTAPTLPSGSSWSAAAVSGEFESSYWKYHIECYVARLTGDQIAIRYDVILSGQYYPSSFYIGLNSDTPNQAACAAGTTTWYYITEAEEGTALTCHALGYDVSSSYLYVNMAAPAKVGVIVKIRSGSTWVEGLVKVRSGGSWVNATALKVRSGGSWTEV